MHSESLIRLGSFVAILAMMFWSEGAFPKRALSAPRLRRYLNNLAMGGMSTLAVRIFLPVLPMGVALYCSANQYGLLHQFAVPYWDACILTILLLDFAVWLQHMLFHKVRALWRVHRMHHADVDIDASTAVRFHPIEIVLSFAYRGILVFILGAPAAAVLVFDVLINCCAVFNHANVSLPPALDRWLRLFVVTPDMHRVHHSTDMREANTNYAFNFPWWDRMFGTYKAHPDKGHENMSIGLNIFRDAKYVSAIRMLAMPFL